MLLGAIERARWCLANPHRAEWTEPHRWPEVVAVAEILTPGRTLAPWGRDKGVQTVVARLCDFLPRQLVDAAKKVRRESWWREGTPKGLTSLSHEVVSRAISGTPGESSVERALEALEGAAT